MKQPEPISKQLPFDIRMALVRAAATPINPSNPMARQKAIDAVRERAISSNPKLFKS